MTIASKLVDADDHQQEQALQRRRRKPPSTGGIVGWSPSRGVRVVKGVTLAICCVVVLGPFLMVISTSFAGQEQIGRAGGLVLFPTHPSVAAYKAVLSGGLVTKALGVSAFVTIIGTALALLLTTLLAYALSRPSPWARPALLLVLASLLFAPGIIPSYLTVRAVGLLDSLWALIIPVLISGFNVIVCRAFFMELPSELIESAKIDGAGEWAIFSRIVLPLSKPILAAIGLFYAVAFWNSFFSALLYLNDNAKWPIQLILRTYLVNGNGLGSDQVAVDNVAPPPVESLRMAILVLSLIPIIAVYPFLQRHFTKGVLTGAVKG